MWKEKHTSIKNKRNRRTYSSCKKNNVCASQTTYVEVSIWTVIFSLAGAQTVNVVAHLNTRKLFSSPWGFLTFFSPCWGFFISILPLSLFFVPPFSLCAYWGSRSGAYRIAVLSLKSQSLASGKNTSWALMQSGHTRSSALRLCFLDFYLQDKTMCRVVR